MTKDVWITVCGIQFLDGEGQEPVKTAVPGEYYYKNGKHYILYDEMAKEPGKLTKNRVKLTADCVEINKRGALNVHMVFRKGVRMCSSYQTPYGALPLQINTHVIEIEETEERINVRMDYTLDMDGASLADYSLTMEICEKETEGLQFAGQ